VRSLGDLKKGSKAQLKGIRWSCESGLALRLMQLGFLEGSEVELVEEAPFTRDPIVVKVRGTLIAIRRSEAQELELSE
jgi:ferrous iron transport protein A